MDDLFDNTKEYYLDNGNIIVVKGKSEKINKYIHCFNTFLDIFWTGYFSNVCRYQNEFFFRDVQSMTKKMVQFANSGEQNFTIGQLEFIDNLVAVKPFNYYPLPYCHKGYPNPEHSYYEMQKHLKFESMFEKYGRHSSIQISVE